MSAPEPPSSDHHSADHDATNRHSTDHHSNGAATDVGLTHVALPVVDLDASIAFYQRYSAMEVVHRRDHVAWISDRTRPFVIVLVQVDSVEGPLLPFGHLGTACRTRADIDRLAGVAQEEGCLISGPTESGPPVGYWCFLRDPDGHTLELSYGQQVTALMEGAEIAGG